MAFSVAASAQTPLPAPAPASSATSAAGMVQMLAGLLLVLAVIGAAAWLLKRMAANPRAARTLKVIAGAAVGPRERVVLVEIGGTWLVLGVAPGQVRALHTMPKASASELPGDELPAPREGFQAWLRQVMEKRDAR